ncbi:MAG: thiamine phosphate synthase [Elusimicrobiota bacterium]|jgi:thiamine-phosphate pyrophosphorylase
MGKTIAPPTLIKRFIASRLYVITCPPAGGTEGYEPMVTAACEGGADVVQFRDKLLSGRERYAVALRLRHICSARNVLFIVNDSLDLALAVGADGVHLGQEDLPLPAARELIGRMTRREFLLGCSTHRLSQALEAERQGADYIGIGPVFATPTKPSVEPVGLQLVREVTARIRIPQVAIGGISAENIQQVLAVGARRVAVVRAVCGTMDIAAATTYLKSILENQKY